MRMLTLASGSSGNCIYFGSDRAHILVDAGISGKRIENALQGAGLSTSMIDAIFVTHEHIDHVKSLGVIARKYGIPIYSNAATRAAFLSDGRLGQLPEGIFYPVTDDAPVQIKDLKISAFSIPHDAADPMGYRIENGGKSAAVATDLGCITQTVVENLKDLDAVILEANHDVNMLEAGSYPFPLKMRILSDTGHLSNEAAGQLLCKILHDNMKHITLGHLSPENNYPALAYETVCSEITFSEVPYKAGDFPIEVAKRETAGHLYEW